MIKNFKGFPDEVVDKLGEILLLSTPIFALLYFLGVMVDD
jgi:hypothetical protein